MLVIPLAWAVIATSAATNLQVLEDLGLPLAAAALLLMRHRVPRERRRKHSRAPRPGRRLTELVSEVAHVSMDAAVTWTPISNPSRRLAVTVQ